MRRMPACRLSPITSRLREKCARGIALLSESSRKSSRFRKRRPLVKVRPGLLNLQTEDTSQTLATRDSFDSTVARLMSTRLLAG